MKKLLFLGALASLGLLSSCSSDDSIAEGPGINDGLQEIKIGFGINANVGTRGTGTVGGFEGENLWKGQKLNLFMLVKDTVKLATFEGEEVFNNTEFYSPEGSNEGYANAVDRKVKYYPTQGNYDFWAYRLDGSATGEPEMKDSTIEIPFTLDGSQDVLVGKAIPSHDDSLACENPERMFSAYSARRGVEPNINFKHLLSRLTFQVKAGNQAICDPTTGVKVDSIKIVSKYTGKLIAAYMGDKASQLIMDNDSTELTLKQREDDDVTKNLVKLTPVTPEWDTDLDATKDTNVGEALLVVPADKYKLNIYLSQNVITTAADGEGEGEVRSTETFSYEDILSTEGGFKAGWSYNVKITIWGLSDIKLKTTLEAWKDGGNIDMKPEDNGRPL